MPAIIAIALFLVGAILAIGATELLLEGLVGLATGLRISAFAISAVLSGFEAENVAVGLAAGSNGSGSTPFAAIFDHTIFQVSGQTMNYGSDVALGTVFGGAIFLVCVALGLGALMFPLEVRLPRGFLILFAASPLLVGLGLIAPVTPRWVGGVLLATFIIAISYLVYASRHKQFLGSEEVKEGQEKHRPLWLALAMTIGGIVVIGIAGELVAQGAEGIIASFGVPVLLMSMIVAPAAIEIEEVFRQAIPSRRGHHDVSAGNLVGTLLYFLLFNLGLIALLTPVRVDPLIRELDWPFLIGITWLATAFLWRGRVGRAAGLLLIIAYAAYIVLHVILR